jgi:DNA topoisomerase-3
MKWYEDKDHTYLIITEKPSQVRALKSVLPKSKNIIIKPLAGHIFELQELEKYKKEFKGLSWFQLAKFKHIPYIPDEFVRVLKNDDYYIKVYNNVKKGAELADYIIIATDPDNEGAAIAKEIIEALDVKDKVIGMINMNRLDPGSLKKEIDILDSIPYEKMADAGYARSEFDWAFGINHTILASVLLGQGNTYHVGGVKSPLIKIVVERENEIKNFVPKKYWEINGKVKTKDGNIFDFKVKLNKESKTIKKYESEIKQIKDKIEKTNDELELKRLKNKLKKYERLLYRERMNFEKEKRRIYEDEINKIKEKLKVGSKLKVTDYLYENDLEERAPLPYSLTDLQTESKFTPSKTLKIAQELYEKTFQSYPRTDCRYFSSKEYYIAKNIIEGLLTNVSTFKSKKLKINDVPHNKIFDDSKVTAHTAIGPTQNVPTLSVLTKDQQTIYKMVATRYLIQFMDVVKYDKAKVEMSMDDLPEILFYSTQMMITDKGWRELYDYNGGNSYVKKISIPSLDKGEEVEIVEIEFNEKETTPPSRYSLNTLLKAMENIGLIYPELDGLDKGIGTPATRAKILDDLIKGGYFEKKGYQLIPTEKAIDLYNKLPDTIVDPKLRADLEYKINQIVYDKMSRKDFYDEMKQLIKAQAEDIVKKAQELGLEYVDKDTLPATEKQIKFAKEIAENLGIEYPKELEKSKKDLAKWIKKYSKEMSVELSKKQVDFIKKYATDSTEMGKEVLKIVEKFEKNGKITNSEKKKVSGWINFYIKSDIYKAKKAKEKGEPSTIVGRKAKSKLTEYHKRRKEKEAKKKKK